MFQLLHTATGKEDVSGWLMSEKLDGWRAAWIASERHFVTRGGKIITPPQWWIDDCPDIDLDGELWAGRGNLSIVQGLFGHSPQWDKITFMFWSRTNGRVLISSGKSGKFEAVKQFPAVSWANIADAYSLVIAAGGEGMVIRDPMADIVPGRSKSILKIKPLPWFEGNPDPKHWTATLAAL